MASSNPFFTRPREFPDNDPNEDEQTPLLYGLASTSARRPFSTSLYPTLYTRATAFILAIPAFIIFVVPGPYYAPTVVFLSFVLARQVVILGSYFGSQIMVVRVEIVHKHLRAMNVKMREKWIQRISGLICDGVVLLGLLITLAIYARQLAICHYCRMPMIKNGLILGFVVCGLLLLSIPDCGMPHLVTMAVKMEKPISGIWKLTSSVQFGESEDEEENGAIEEVEAGMSAQDTGKAGVV